MQRGPRQPARRSHRRRCRCSSAQSVTPGGWVTQRLRSGAWPARGTSHAEAVHGGPVTAAPGASSSQDRAGPAQPPPDYDHRSDLACRLAPTGRTHPAQAASNAPLRRVARPRAPAGCSHAAFRWFKPPSRPPRRWRPGGQCRFWIQAERRVRRVSPFGVVKWFDPDRGTGLISQEGAGPDVQTETSAIQGEDGCLRHGEEVFFNTTLDSWGLRADNIHRSVRREARRLNPSDVVTLHQGLLCP
ncbi:cold shock domain-containing protein [Streptomyces sp. NPDC058646]|uniref:cold shock domain-containing protein n=1 Tax=Streptomyces sp. NPDC058646 TaxID=3346574 RepID=UPI003663B8CA